MEMENRKNWWDDHALAGVVGSALCLAAIYGLERGLDSWIGRDSGIDYLYLLPLWVGVSVGGRRAGLVASVMSALVVSNIRDGGAFLTASHLVVFSANLVAFLAVAYLFDSFGRRLAKARTAASTDPLTGIANRRSGIAAARAMASGAQQTGGRIAVVAMDCDGFKQINDRHGHSAGDQALKSVARSLSQSVRATDKVFRLGGDEFVMVLAEAGPLEAEVCLGRLRSKLAKASDEAGFAIQITAGCAVAPRDGVGFDELLHSADARLYRNKRLARSFAPPTGTEPAASL